MHRFGLTARAKSKSPSGIEDRSNWLVSKSYVTARGVALDLDRKEPRADTSETGALGANQMPSHELATFIEQRHGVRIEVRFLPLLRASVRGQEVLERARLTARAMTQTAEKPSIP